MECVLCAAVAVCLGVAMAAVQSMCISESLFTHRLSLWLHWHRGGGNLQGHLAAL